MTPLETAWQEFVERNPSVWSAHQESNQPKVVAVALVVQVDGAVVQAHRFQVRDE